MARMDDETKEEILEGEVAGQGEAEMEERFDVKIMGIVWGTCSGIDGDGEVAVFYDVKLMPEYEGHFPRVEGVSEQFDIQTDIVEGVFKEFDDDGQLLSQWSMLGIQKHIWQAEQELARSGKTQQQVTDEAAAKDAGN